MERRQHGICCRSCKGQHELNQTSADPADSPQVIESVQNTRGALRCFTPVRDLLKMIVLYSHCLSSGNLRVCALEAGPKLLIYLSHMLHVQYIYLYLAHLWCKCRQILHTWSIWVFNMEMFHRYYAGLLEGNPPFGESNGKNMLANPRRTVSSANQIVGFPIAK